MSERIVVVGAALLDAGRLLAARRSAPPELAGRWELPGGKVEPGETPEQALARELHEELGVRAQVLARVPGEWPLREPYALQVWTARLRPASAAPAPLQDHDELRWLAPDELWSVDWLDQDWRRCTASCTPSTCRRSSSSPATSPGISTCAR
ncbi:(deoxy)nucleoside triphosphate pyrophosphohydrolase, partial [Streptomyces sp. NPDC048279]|uniref:(deoxy)nucleoside triphosphate pyrophosphohydrolase n=1 Tax=Streptomyces sp. NPDC048279 TaxID=3154714 RepID=UPI0034262E89